MNGPPAVASPGGGESRASIWARRCVSMPMYFALATVCFVGAPVWMAAAALADCGNRPRRTWARTRALCFFALYLALDVAGIVAAATLAVVRVGGRLGGPKRYLSDNAALQRWWSSALFNGAVALFSMRVEVEGALEAAVGPYLLFVRHSSTADTVLAAALVGNPHRMLFRYVLKRQLLWEPCLDVVGRRLPNAFVSRNRERSTEELAQIAALANGLDEKSAVLIYPEGTRFSERKRRAAIASLRERGRADLAAIADAYLHVLPPRLGGPLALVEAAPGVDVVIVEHTGFEGSASFSQFWSGALIGRTIRARLRRIPSSAIPNHDRDRWLFEQWAKTDRWITDSLALEGAP